MSNDRHEQIRSAPTHIDDHLIAIRPGSFEGLDEGRDRSSVRSLRTGLTLILRPRTSTIPDCKTS